MINLQTARRVLLPLLFVCGFGVMSGCNSMSINQFSNQSPAFILEDYFVGQTWAWGFFSDRFGNVKRRFRVDISGTLIDQNTLVLDEHFIYDDGELDSRVWTITRLDDSTYSGKANDVIGEATGIQSGNALQWQYRLNLPVGNSVWKVKFTDWMFLQDNNILLNQATVSKWGFTLGRVNIFFTKTAPTSDSGFGSGSNTVTGT